MTDVQFQWRNDTAADWTSNNPVLILGEPGLESDTGKFKIGDGVTAWNSLDYHDASLEAEIATIGLRQIVTFTASGSFLKAAYPWLKYVRVRGVGGGGAGGSIDATSGGQSAASGGGGSGGFFDKIIPVASLLVSETITIGGGGVVGAAGENPGGDGGTTSVGAHCSATGGGGGTGGAATAGTQEFVGGTGGIASGGDVNIPGSPGGNGYVAGGIAIPGYYGGASQLSGAAVLSDGLDYGGGGSGFSFVGAAGADTGYPGADGIVIVELYG